MDGSRRPPSPSLPLGVASRPPLADLAARMQLDSPVSLRTTARDLAEEAGFPYLLSQAGQAGQGISMPHGVGLLYIPFRPIAVSCRFESGQRALPRFL